MKKILFLAVLLIAFVSAVVFAEKTTPLQVENAWARESPPTVANGAAYMTLFNSGDETDRLVAASGNIAETIELHTHLMEDGVMKMRQVEAIEVSTEAHTVLEPGGLHIMLIGLQAPLQAGQTFPLTLEFEKAGKMTIDVEVAKMGDMPMSGHQHHGSPDQ
jgi:copper(I)-binding protein